jgi:hypothetical protein
MMKFLRYIVLFFAITIYLGGCSSSILRSYYNAGLIADDYRYGDLYRLANLPQFKARQAACPPGVPASAPRQPYHLYLLGDSFTEPGRISAADFTASHYQYVHWDKPHAIQLDTTKTNILILETVERHFREHFSRGVDELRVMADTTRPPVSGAVSLSWSQRIQDLEMVFSTRDAVNERLENLLFSSDFFLWFKEVKAQLNYQWFERVNPKVTVTPGGSHLLYGIDTDTSTISASFTPLEQPELNRLVDSVNHVAARYRKLGFDQVYLNIIPNKTSILAYYLGEYNRLIDRVQRHPHLEVPIIDVYTPFKASPSSVYEVSDSHWNCQGRSIWLREVDKKLNLSSL